MRPVRALTIYILSIFVGGALLAPWLYWLVQSLAGTFPHLAGSPFHRFVNRSFLVIALAGLWPLWRMAGAGSWSDLGLVKVRGHWGNLGNGFVLGFGSLALVALLALGTGARVWMDSPTRLAQKLGGAAATAVVVALLEEVLFRGTLFGGLRKCVHWVWALVISSIVYALVHFMESARQAGPVEWYSGFELLPRMLRGLANWHSFFPGFFNLSLAGALLALAYQRTGNLYYSIGLHGGWIFWLKSYGNLTREVPGANVWVWGGGKLIDGWMAFVVLLLTLVFCERWALASRPERAKLSA